MPNTETTVAALLKLAAQQIEHRAELADMLESACPSEVNSSLANKEREGIAQDRKLLGSLES